MASSNSENKSKILNPLDLFSIGIVNASLSLRCLERFLDSIIKKSPYVAKQIKDVGADLKPSPHYATIMQIGFVVFSLSSITFSILSNNPSLFFNLVSEENGIAWNFLDLLGGVGAREKLNSEDKEIKNAAKNSLLTNRFMLCATTVYQTFVSLAFLGASCTPLGLALSTSIAGFSFAASMFASANQARAERQVAKEKIRELTDQRTNTKKKEASKENTTIIATIEQEIKEQNKILEEKNIDFWGYSLAGAGSTMVACLPIIAYATAEVFSFGMFTPIIMAASFLFASMIKGYQAINTINKKNDEKKSSIELVNQSDSLKEDEKQEKNLNSVFKFFTNSKKPGTPKDLAHKNPSILKIL